MFEITSDHTLRGSVAPTMRDARSGLPGFGGRPSLHPAWRDEDALSDDAQSSRAVRLPLR